MSAIPAVATRAGPPVAASFVLFTLAGLSAAASLVLLGLVVLPAWVLATTSPTRFLLRHRLKAVLLAGALLLAPPLGIAAAYAS